MGAIYHGIKHEHKNVTLLNTQSVNEWMNELINIVMLEIGFINQIYWRLTIPIRFTIMHLVFFGSY